MADSILTFYLFFGSAFSLVIALGQLVQRGKEPILYVFAASFAGLAVWSFYMALYASGLFAGTPFYEGYLRFALPFVFTVPPTMALRYRWITRGAFQPARLRLFLMVPAVLMIPLALYPFVSGYQVTGSFLEPEPLLPRGGSFIYEELIRWMLPLSHLYLIVLMLPVLISMSTVWRRQRHNEAMVAARTGYVFAAIIVLTNVMALVGELFIIGLLKTAMVMAITATVALYLVTQRRPDYLRLIKSETRRARYEHTRLKGLDVNGITARLRELMEDEAVYAVTDLTLAMLASELGISGHQLSEIINQQMGMNFNSYVNSYRVSAAKRMLLDESDRSIISIGSAVGFSSITTFNSVFSRLTGMSPGKFRKQHQNENV